MSRSDPIAPVPRPPDPAALQKAGFTEEALPWLDSVYRFSLRLTDGREAEAEDLTQETFLRAYRHWSTYTPGTSCRSWLFTICRNAFLRTQERRGRRPERLQSELAYDIEAVASTVALQDLAEADPERRFFDSIVDAEVTAAIAKLPDSFRDAVVLSDLENLSYQEVADVLGVPVGTVKSRLYRGRRLLAEALKTYAIEMGYIRGAMR